MHSVGHAPKQQAKFINVMCRPSTCSSRSSSSSCSSNNLLPLNAFCNVAKAAGWLQFFAVLFSYPLICDACVAFGLRLATEAEMQRFGDECFWWELPLLVRFTQINWPKPIYCINPAKCRLLNANTCQCIHCQKCFLKPKKNISRNQIKTKYNITSWFSSKNTKMCTTLELK